MLKLHQQFKYLYLIKRLMFSKTEFNPSNHKLTLVPERFSFPDEEEKILKFWQEN